MISPTIDLGSVARVLNGKTPSKNEQRGHGFPVLKIKDIDEYGCFRGTFDSFVDSDLPGGFSEKIVRKNDILILNAAHNADYVASKYFFANGSAVGALATGEWLIIRANTDRLHPRYASYWLESSATKSKIRDIVRGIHLYPTDVAEMAIQLPSLSDQQRIARMLEQADRLRRMRRYALQMCDELLPPAFLEMFGDLNDNEHKWSFDELDEHSNIVSGVAKGHKYGNKQTISVPYLRVANVQDGYLDLSEIKIIQALPADIETLRLQPDDILMTEGGEFDKLGRGAIWPGGITNCIHQNHIFRVRLNQSVLLPTFFAAFLRNRFAKDYFLRCSKQTTNLASINMTQLRATPVPLPPLSLQKKFASVVHRHQHLRATHVEALRQADHLFQTLLHQVFSDH